MTIHQLLAGNPVFKGLSEQHLGRVSGMSSLRSCEREQAVYEPDSLGTHIFILMEGRVRLWMPTASSEFSFVVGQIRKGELFGLSPLLGTSRHATTARCAEPSTVLAIEAQPLHHLMDEEPAVGYRVMSEASKAYFARYTESLRRFQSILSHIAAPA